MFIATNCEQYSYTKITVPIKLLKSPSDYDDCIYYLDIIGDDFSQEQCYIGTQKIEEGSHHCCLLFSCCFASLQPAVLMQKHTIGAT